MANEPPPGAIDYDRARALCNGNEGLLRKLLAHFSSSIPGDLLELESHVARGEPDPVGRIAHRIKGQAASLAIEGVREAALRIEDDARADRLEAAREDLESLKERVTEFLHEIGGTMR